MTDLPEELASADPQEVLTFLREAADDEVREAVHRLGTPVVLDLLFAGMAERFGPAPRRPRGRLAFALDDDGTEHRRVVELAAAGAVVGDPAGRARATVSTTLVRFLRVAAGAADPKALVLTGRLRIGGDPVWAVRVLSSLGS